MVVKKGGFGNWSHDPLSSNRNESRGESFVMLNPDSKRGSIWGVGQNNDCLDIKTSEAVSYLLKVGLGINPQGVSSSIKSKIANLIREGKIKYPQGNDSRIVPGVGF